MVFIGGGWLIGKIVGNTLLPESNDTHGPDSGYNFFIDSSTHHHFHVHSSEKSGEIKKLGAYVDSLHDTEVEDITDS